MRLVLLLLLAATAATHAFVLDLESTEQRCVFDVLKLDMLCTGHYSVLNTKNEQDETDDNAESTGVSITVTDPVGELVFKTERAKDGKFSFISQLEGRHDICVTNSHLLRRRVELRLKSGAEARDLSEVAQQDHLVPLAVELLRLEEVAEEVRHELKYLFQSEADMREVTAHTNRRVKYSTVFSVAVIVAVGLWQYFHVRAFLAAKKVAGRW